MPSGAINGIQLYYEASGEGPSAIVFAHGAGGNHLSWWQQVPFFNKRYKCVTFSHRRFHLSRDIPNGPGASAFVADLVGLLDHLGIREAVLVGQSMGGITCFGFALSYPERVKALIMADTTLGIPSSQIRDVMATARKEQQQKGVAPNSYSSSFPKREPALYYLYEEIRALNGNVGTADVSATMPRTVPDVDLSKFAVPTLFLFGSEDAMIPPAAGRLAHELIPGSEYVEVAGAGHSTYFERPQEFNRAIADFLSHVGV